MNVRPRRLKYFVASKLKQIKKRRMRRFKNGNCKTTNLNYSFGRSGAPGTDQRKILGKAMRFCSMKYCTVLYGKRNSLKTPFKTRLFKLFLSLISNRGSVGWVGGSETLVPVPKLVVG